MFVTIIFLYLVINIFTGSNPNLFSFEFKVCLLRSFPDTLLYFHIVFNTIIKKCNSYAMWILNENILYKSSYNLLCARKKYMKECVEQYSFVFFSIFLKYISYMNRIWKMVTLCEIIVEFCKQILLGEGVKETIQLLLPSFTSVR